ncbi:MAG: hypothetical protein E7293_10455 [Lachnospiraceae bacterium]|nr:hypothetical protein [Lachnospiraceae bacterium]
MELEYMQNIIKEIICEKILPGAEIKANDILAEKGIDSIKIIELVVEIELKFDFEFEDEKLTYETLRSIKDIAMYVNSRLKTIRLESER